MWRTLLCTGLILVASTLSAGEIRIELNRDAGRTGAVEVHGLTSGQLQEACDRAEKSGWNAVFPVRVGTDDAAPPMLGEYNIAEDTLRFTPRFPLEPGLTYTAVFRATGTANDAASAVRREIEIAAEPSAQAARVVHVYPSAGVLPENLLKFYLHFSAPMSRGDSYRHIRLVREDGYEVDLPFLELGEELWNGDGTRLTVFFDPGRIKRGLKPREEFGPVLEEGKRYSLVIDRKWLDARGHPLDAGFRKEFRVDPPDDEQPAPSCWKLSAARAESREPLVVFLDESLDHALLERGLTVRDAAGAVIQGEVAVAREETRWEFQPDTPWAAGSYELVVRSVLEDLAGNSVGRPFELDIVRPIETDVPRETVSVPFRVR